MKTIILFISILLTETTQAQSVSEYWAQKVEAEAVVLKEMIENESQYSFGYYLYNISDQNNRLAEVFKIYRQSVGLLEGDSVQDMDSSRVEEGLWGMVADMKIYFIEMSISLASEEEPLETKNELLEFLSSFQYNWSEMRKAYNKNAKQ